MSKVWKYESNNDDNLEKQVKMSNGKPVLNAKQRCNFDTFYFCYKMNLKRDIIFLE